MSTEEKVHENRMRRIAARQGLILIKSRRRDPRARGFGRYVLVPDNRANPYDPRDEDQEADAQIALDRGAGLTKQQVEQALLYGSALLK